MISIFQSRLTGLDSVLNLHTTCLSNKNKQRWHMAFATIYCSRAFSACLEANKKRKVFPILPSNPVIVIDVFEPPHPCFSNIDKSSLTQLVNKKYLTQLVEKYDGVEGLASSLKTNLEHGINGDDEEEILSRYEAFDTNTYQRPPMKGFYRFVWEALKDPTIIILLVCATLSLGFGIKENGLKEGWRQQVSIFEIVVGDVVCLKIGDQVPADCTKMADGFGRMLVTSVGMNTTWGAMMSTISRDTSEQTPLQARLNKLTSAIGKVHLVVAFLVLVVLLVRYCTGNTKDTNGNTEFNGNKTEVDDIINSVMRIVVAAVTIVVVAIPEGLPLTVTLALAYSMKRMMADQAMV
ncbi:hypothetical protein TEA_027244 [Camellia sinensis var. sinensis]|uniref:Cation-transporting P-type ATPase N-terminal domain-containing protein n=1 Tax=Camellia sinensis var. sinensis TaxID=542762 RepID=A0A4S4EUL4_CAMSN|nr:hypothetical protein TEA_027244 [Camellia sinensis var. sinensis]